MGVIEDTTGSKLDTVDITSPKFKADPFPFFAQLRAESPIYRTQLPDRKPLWIISRYEDVNLLLKDERFLKNPKNAMTLQQQRKPFWLPSVLNALERNMLDLDAPEDLISALIQAEDEGNKLKLLRGLEKLPVTFRC